MPGCLQVSSYPLIISLYAGRSLEENQGDSGGSWPWGNHDGIGCFFFREPVHKSEKPRRTIEKPQKNHRIDLKPTGRDEVEGKTWLAWEATEAQLERGLPPGDVLATLKFSPCSLAKKKPVTWFITPSKLIQAVYFLLILAFDTQKKCLSSAKFVVAPFEKWQALQIEDPNYESTLII